MIGNHAIPVITEAYLKGIRNFDVEKAYEAMKKTSLTDRAGMGVYRKYHYIPYELENESVSKTLEYAYDDWCIAQMAKALQRRRLSFLFKRLPQLHQSFRPRYRFYAGQIFCRRMENTLLPALFQPPGR